ncbi:MAG: hypothetical protein U5L45_21135 [Saprospiraceae bacterium]|nr:hypothetical protein [Saprospiraceae bacterium]
MKHLSHIVLFAVVLSVIACKRGEKIQTAPNTLTETAPIELPKTPEAVVRTWESQIEQNQFALAKLISIGKTLEAVIGLDSTNNMQQIPPSGTKILSIACSEKGDKATCDCMLEDTEGKIQCKYFLSRQSGQWYLEDAASEPVEDTSPKFLVNQKPVKSTTK